MNILLSTTIGHNPGDELIRDGVQNLLKLVYPYSHLNFVHYNRNPDLQHGEGREARTRTIGNYQCGDVDLSYIDMVVLAGSPEWSGGPMKSLYEVLVKSDVPFMALGIGLGHPDLKLTKLDVEALKKAKKITTRSQETTDFLASYGIESKALVCPALFSAQQFSNTGQDLLQIVQASGEGWHEVDKKLLHGLSGADLGLVHVKELKRSQKNIGKKIYISNSHEFREKASSYERVHSTRLHGAIGALSLGIPSVVIADGDFRIETAAKMFGEYLPIVKNFEEAYKAPVQDKTRLREYVTEQRTVYLRELNA